MAPLELDQKSRDNDRDKRAVEAAAMLLLLGYFDEALNHAQQAIKLGTSPATAAASVLSGNPATHQPGIAPILANAAVKGWMMGRVRTAANAHAYTTGRRLPLAGVQKAVKEAGSVLKPTGEHGEALQRIVQGVGGSDVVQARYDAALRRVQPFVRNIEDRLSQRLNQIKVEGPAFDYQAPPGAHLPDAISLAMEEARIAFEKTGIGTRTTLFIPDRRPREGQVNTAANAETIVESIVANEYEAGRSDGAATQKALWGWYWSAVIDGHECPKCRKLHGTQAPLDDPLWLQFGPQLHFGCRCSRIEVYRTTETPTIRRPDLTDSDILEGVKQRQALLNWWQGIPNNP